MEKASAAGGEPALSSDTRRCTLGSPGRIGRKEGGREGRRSAERSLRGLAVPQLASRRCVHKQQVLCTRVQSNTCNTPRASIACQSATAHSFRSVRPSRGSLAGSSGPVLLGRRTGFFFLRPSSQACRGLQKREDSKRSIGAGRPLQPRCLLACCLRAEFKKTARNCLISQPCRGRSFVLWKQASSTAVHHHHPASSSSSSSSLSFSLSLCLPNIAAWLTGRLKQFSFSLVLR